MSRLQLEDITLYYEVSGEGDPVLLIHGLGSSSRDWEPPERFNQVVLDFLTSRG